MRETLRRRPPVLVGVALAGVVAVLAAGAAAATARPAPSGTARAGCRGGRLVTVRIADLPGGVGANAVLFGPRRHRLALHRGRSMCLRTGAYELVARPVRVGKGQVAYPSGASGPLTVQSARFRVPPRAPLVLAVSYEDVAPVTTLVLPTGSAVVPRSRRLLLQYGAFAVHRTSATAALRVGDIVVEPVGRGVPHGLLGRVTSVARHRRTLSLRTVRVSPFEAFTRASLTIRLRRRRFTQILHYPARGTQARLLPRQGTALGCGPSVNDLSGTASLSFTPNGYLSLSWSDPDWFDPQVNGSFSISPGLSIGATLSATEGVNCSITQDLGTVPLGSYCTDFGCFTLNLVGTASLSVGVAQPFSESFSESLNGSIGASFRFGVVTPSFTPQDSLALTGSLSGSQQPDAWQGSITAGIGPALQVLYGIPDVAGVGPQLGAQDQLTLAGDPSGWNLSGGVGGRWAWRSTWRGSPTATTTASRSQARSWRRGGGTRPRRRRLTRPSPARARRASR